MSDARLAVAMLLGVVIGMTLVHGMNRWRGMPLQCSGETLVPRAIIAVSSNTTLVPHARIVLSSPGAIHHQSQPLIAVGMVLRQKERGADETLHFHTSSWLATYADGMLLAPSLTTSLQNDSRVVRTSERCRRCQSHPMGPVRGLSCRRWTLLREMRRTKPAAGFFVVLSDDVVGNMTALSDRLAGHSPAHPLYAGYAAKTAVWPVKPMERMRNQLSAWGMAKLHNMSRAWQIIPHIAGGPGFVFSRHTVDKLLHVFDHLDAYNTCTDPDDIWLGLIMGRYLGLHPTHIFGFHQDKFHSNLFSNDVKLCQVSKVGPTVSQYGMYADPPLRCNDLVLMHAGSGCDADSCPLADLRQKWLELCSAGHRNLMFQKVEQSEDGIKPIETEGVESKNMRWIACECTTVECCETYPYICSDASDLPPQTIIPLVRDVNPNCWADKAVMALTGYAANANKGILSEQAYERPQQAYDAITAAAPSARKSKYEEFVNETDLARVGQWPIMLQQMICDPA